MIFKPLKLWITKISQLLQLQIQQHFLGITLKYYSCKTTALQKFKQNKIELPNFPNNNHYTAITCDCLLTITQVMTD